MEEFIVQFDTRFKTKKALPTGFSAQDFAEDLFKFVHGTLIPKYGLEAYDSDQAPKYSYHKHVSTNRDACEGCIATAQDGEN